MGEIRIKANDPEFNIKDEEVKIEIKQEQKLNEAEEIKAKSRSETKNEKKNTRKVVKILPRTF